MRDAEIVQRKINAPGEVSIADATAALARLVEAAERTAGTERELRRVEAIRADYENGFRQAVAERDRAIYLAEHLFQMIDKETWRAQGAEYMGQYEGDHWAEQTFEELKSLKDGTWKP